MSRSTGPAVVLLRAKPDFVIVNLRQLVTPPRGLTKLNIAEAERLLTAPPRPTALMPADPHRPPPPRPRTGSEALSLADRALERGDALDAAAQYRALLADPQAQNADYLRFQLGRAYLALDRRVEAVALLRDVASRPTTMRWPALVALADARCAEVDAETVMRELAPLAADDAELLADHLVNRVPIEQARVLLVAKAVRTGECGYAFQALSDGASRDGVPKPCIEMLEKRVGFDPLSAEHVLAVRVVEFHRHWNKVVDHWNRLAARIDANHPDPNSWVDLAEDALQLRPVAATSEQIDTIRITVAAALDVAIVLSLDLIPPDETYRRRIVGIAQQLAANGTDDLPRRVRGVLRAD